MIYFICPFAFALQEAVQVKGLRDDTTCIVIDIQPPEKPIPPPAPHKKQVKGVLKSMFKKKSSESSSHAEKGFVEPDVVEELFEEGSALLAERFVLLQRIVICLFGVAFLFLIRLQVLVSFGTFYLSISFLSRETRKWVKHI